jgi:hypothetical protein
LSGAGLVASHSTHSLSSMGRMARHESHEYQVLQSGACWSLRRIRRRREAASSNNLTAVSDADAFARAWGLLIDDALDQRAAFLPSLADPVGVSVDTRSVALPEWTRVESHLGDPTVASLAPPRANPPGSWWRWRRNTMVTMAPGRDRALPASWRLMPEAQQALSARLRCRPHRGP